LVIDAESTVTGLRLLGGLVRIASIVSRSHLTDAPDADPVLSAGIEVAGIEVAGSPAQLTEDGLVVGTGEASGPLAQQAASQVADALADSGLRMELLPSEEGEVDGEPLASAGGLLIELTAPVTGLPPAPGPSGDLDLNGDYGVRLQLGTTGARGFADAFGDDAAPAPASPVAVGASGGGSSSSASGATPAGSSAAPAAPAPLTGAAPGLATEPAGALADILADRLGLIYLAFTLTAIAMGVAPTLTLPARLPGVPREGP
jgi:hypothetical protein